MESNPFDSFKKDLEIKVAKEHESVPIIFLPLKSLSPGVRLAPRQKQIIEILQKNLQEKSLLISNKELAKELGLAEPTIKTYLLNLTARTGVSSKIELAFLDIKENQVSDKPHSISFASIRIPHSVKISDREKSMIEQIHKTVMDEKHTSQKQLAHELDMTYGTYKIKVSLLLKKLGLESYLQLGFLDMDDYKKAEEGVSLT